MNEQRNGERPAEAYDSPAALREMVGYLNFSQGKPDPRFQQHINEFYRACGDEDPWNTLRQDLRHTIDLVRDSSAAFRDVSQAEAVLSLVFEKSLSAYREHHRDLLSHLPDRDLLQPFFLARLFESVLAEGGPWAEVDRVVPGSIERLNDFIGHRPVAVLEKQKCEPYDHERVRPIPLFIRGAGVAVGKYHEIVARTLDILDRTGPELQAQAHFSLELLDELSLDPRAYDFGHPVNQRPNYQFGEWDPHCLDNQARYRRFVVRSVTLDALQDRVADSGGTAADELLFEAAAVLAGTILMASVISGSGPDTHDSSVTLATLVPKIAQFRDAFYAGLLSAVPGSHGEQLRREADRLRQPFGGARQHLNQSLSRQRAAQLQHVHLAKLFALMGYPEASREQGRIIPTASARILCEMQCRITASHLNLDRGELVQAATQAAPLEELLHRGIGSGAIVDPWNILGFQGQFSIFAALENSVPDPRVDQITELMEQIFTLYARLLASSAAEGDKGLERQVTKQFRELAAWWDQFASLEISGIRQVYGQEAVESATHVAKALAAWHQAGEAAGDIRFWRERSEGFNSPRAYAQVVRALLERNDHIAAMALLVSWLSQVEQVPLEWESHSFHELAVRWILSLVQPSVGLMEKFFDYLEANADEYWQVPGLEFDTYAEEDEGRNDESVDDEEDNVFSAAYDGVSFRDSAEDGHEGEMIEGGPPDRDFDLEFAAMRIEPRLRFLCTLATLWQIAASPSLPTPPPQGENANRDRTTPASKGRHPEQVAAVEDRDETYRAWLTALQRNQLGLAKLLDSVQEHVIAQPSGSHDSMVEYDRRRTTKERLIYAVIATQVATAQAIRRLLACLATTPQDMRLTDWELLAVDFERALLRGDASELRAQLPGLLESVAKQPTIYRRLDKGGKPQEIVATKCIQQLLRSLVESLPRAGLLRETYHVLKTARLTEEKHPIRGEGITEFDHLFRAAVRAVFESVLGASRNWEPVERLDAALLECLQELTEPFLKLWLEYSQSLRLSTLDRISSDKEWSRIREFIERYGHDLLTPKFLTFANIRAILDRGALRYLEYLEENPDPLHPFRLADELDQQIKRTDAARLLETVLNIFAENYDQYRDYNTTTAQSDYGERFFILFEFLRLKAWYERTSWNLEPLGIVHEILAQKGRTEAAHLWQDSLGERTAAMSAGLLAKLTEIETQFGVRLISVRDQLQEQFTRPLALDRIRILIEPAMDETGSGSTAGECHAFHRLRQELEVFAETTTGSGLDVPDWLQSLEHDVRRTRFKRQGLADPSQIQFRTRPAPLSRTEIEQQLKIWEQPL